MLSKRNVAVIDSPKATSPKSKLPSQSCSVSFQYHTMEGLLYLEILGIYPGSAESYTAH